MKKNMAKNNKLEDEILLCNLIVFDKPNLDTFIDSEEIISDIKKIGLLNSFDYKVLNKERSIMEFSFYSDTNKYEISDHLYSLLKKHNYGFSYKISSTGY